MRVKTPKLAGAVWPLAFLVFFLMGAGWALATPYAGGPDEVRQIIRAAGVAEGQVFAKPVSSKMAAYTGAFQTVPQGLVAGGLPGYKNTYCYHLIPTQSASCTGVPGGPHASVQHRYLTGNGRYNPIYYALVGGPLVLWPDWTGILLARLISVALCAAFLASAFLSCREWRRSPMMTAGFVIAATPTFFSMSGVINPNSLEMAAGVSLCAAAIPLLLDEDSPDTGRWLRRAAIAAIGIGQFRSLGPILIAGVLGVLMIPPVRGRLRYLWQQRSVRWWSAGLLVSCVLGIAWTIAFKTYQVAKLGYGHYHAWGAIIKIEITGRLLRIVTEMVSGFAYASRAPGFIFQIWMFALGALLLGAYAWGSKPDRWRITWLIGVAGFIAVATDLGSTNTYGWSFYGRYIYPLAAGIPLLAGFAFGRSGALSLPRQTSLYRAIVLILLPVHLISIVYMMARWERGAGRGLDPFSGSWTPVTGAGLPLLLMVVGLGLYGWMAWRAGLPPDEQSARPEAAPAEVLSHSDAEQLVEHT
jgi:hypothetical protein